MSKFDRQLKKFEKVVETNSNSFLRKVLGLCFNGVTFRSPVDEGRFRAEWRVRLNQPDLSTDDEGAVSVVVAGSPPTSSELAKLIGPTRRIKPGDYAWITNNLPYADFLERGGSDQAPDGVAQKTVDEVAGLISSGAIKP